MALWRLLIRDFRSIIFVTSPPLIYSWPPISTFLVGRQRQRETSVLEAIYTLGHSRTFCCLQSGRVIHHEQLEFVLHGRYSRLRD